MFNFNSHGRYFKTNHFLLFINIILTIIGFGGFLDFAFSFVFGLLLFTILLIVNNKILSKRVKINYNKFLNFTSIFISVLISLNLHNYFNYKIMQVSFLYEFCLIVSAIYFLFFPVRYILNIYVNHIKIKVINYKLYLQTIFSLLLPLYMIFIQIPTDVYFNNIDEFVVSYPNVIYGLIIKLIKLIFALSFVLIIFNEKWLKIVSNLSVLLAMGIYIQYMFLNRNINLVDGSVYIWTKDIIFSSISFGIWLLILIICIYMIFNKKIRDYSLYRVAIFLIFIQVISLFLEIVSANDSAFSEYTYLVDHSDEYKLGCGSNIIVLVMDAIDNDFVEEIYNNNNNELFNDYSDFTLYTNTCSVYDMTAESMSQMLTGCKLDHLNDFNISDEFYSRLNNNGYVVNIFRYDYNHRFPDVRPYFDNFKYVKQNKDNCFVDFDLVSRDFLYLSLYDVLPNMLKIFINVNNLEFNYISSDVINDYTNCNNSNFMNSMNFEIKQNYTNLLSLYHINGAHFPCDDVVKETTNCLEIGCKMIRQLKMLNIYDSTTIIIMSDHGLHDQQDPYVWPTAGTPLFMIKEAYSKKDCILLSDAPIYYEDFMATILVNANLYDKDKDYELFGPSIYDFKSGDLRRRVWNDTCNKGFRRYEYIGNYSDLKKCVNDDKEARELGYVNVDSNYHDD